ncbi:TPR repeat [Geosmithia morbida]|uniref:TPR repeat n=1 Tax=Geosmithia morbida TaxID=1094350 RepID=A0A9P4YXE2_9HYPO|nr:TPR repeat [Geosmithia morbida]KAF4124605.1 TPR repeat [Geosmithia morbida]
MAYHAAHGPPAQAYGGPQPGAPRPPPQGRGGPPPQQPYAAPAQQYDGYDDYNAYANGNGYGYDDYANGGSYGQQDYGGGDPYQNPDYGRAPPPPRQDYYGPPPAGRVGRRPSMNDGSASPRQVGHGDAYGHGDMDQMAKQMSGMDLNGQMPSRSMSSSDGQRGRGRGGMSGRGGPRGGPPPPQQQGYYGPEYGPSQGDGGGYGGYDDGYSQPEFGPPGRTMTMPNGGIGGPPQDMLPPQRARTMSYDDPAGRGVPQRPSTASGQRPPPQRAYPGEPQGPVGYDQYAGGGGYDDYGPGVPPERASYEGGYNVGGGGDGGGGPYYDPGRGSYQSDQYSNHSGMPDFDMIPSNARSSFDQVMQPTHEYPQPGAHQTAKLNHAKSQPELRQPQTAVFEMAGDIPAVPPMPPMNTAVMNGGVGTGMYGPGPMHGPVPGSVPGYGPERMVPSRGPSAPPGPTNLPAPTPMGPSSRNPDSLPSHPTPIRAGLMANSMVNMNDKPPPVRNYGGVPPAVVAARTQPQAQQQIQGAGPQAVAQVRVVPQKQPEPPVTSQELEQLRMSLKVNANDSKTALRLAKRLIEASDVLVAKMPDPRARGRARERYVMDAHKILRKLASAQNTEAMFIMADNLGRGTFGGEPDTKEAFTLYQAAAKLSHAGAAYRTAVCCEIGHEDGGGTRRDPLKAMQWYKRAATLGDPPAMYKVGMILLKGLLGQPRNPHEAIGWLRRAADVADSENPHALHELGLLYESAEPVVGDALVRDERAAFSLFLQSAELGYKFSQFRLGCAYEYGSLGCPVDARMSIMWYSQAAQRGEHQSELSLSGWYLTGSEGVLKQSDQEAYLWARKAAMAGLAKAEYAMGYFTEMGIGCAANVEDAKRWYWRAAAQDFPKARERLEDIKRGKNNPSATRPPDRFSRSKIEKHQEGECIVM